jgi:hypothetical protein
LLINYQNSFYKIKQQNSFNIPKDEFLFKEGITYNGSGSKGVSFRYLSNYELYDMGASAIFADDNITLLGILNTKLIFYITDCLNPNYAIEKKITFKVKNPNA